VSESAALHGVPHPVRTGAGGRGRGIGPGIRKRFAAEAPRSVRIALYVFIATIPFESFPIADFLTGRFSLARAAGFLFFLMALFNPRTALRRPHAAVWWLGLWIAVVAAHIPWLDRTVVPEAVVHVAQLTQMLIFLWVASNVLRSQRAWRTALIVLVCSCFALALVQAVGGVNVQPGVDDRVTAMGENPNTVGAMFALALVAAIGLAREIVHGWKRTALLVACVPLALQMIRTGSRAAMLALVIGLIVMMVRSRGFGGKLKAVLAAIPLLFLFGLAVASSEGARARIAQIVEEGRFARREFIVPLTLEMIREKPVVGWGPEVHLRELGTRMNREKMDEHNLILWVLNEGGLVAFIPFLIGVLLSTRDADRGRHAGRGTLPLALLATLAAANMAHSHHNRKITWLLLGAAISTPYIRSVRPSAARAPRVAPRPRTAVNAPLAVPPPATGAAE
jgi:O-antigen ligase